MSVHFVDVRYGDILWEGCLAKPIEQQRYWHSLNREEKNKALSFTRPELQKKYIKTRGVLREVLAHYCADKAVDIDINVSEHGKPFVNDPHVYFNLSHTGNRFVVAVSNFSAIGIDLEQYRERKNLSGLVGKCFSAEEQSYWYGLPMEQQTNIFYQFWVRKEAFVKATGRGIALGLDQCVINIDDSTQFLRIPKMYGVPTDWKIQAVHLNEIDICALVVKNEVFEYKQKVLDF